jgi:hypothetical protein
VSWEVSSYEIFPLEFFGKFLAALKGSINKLFNIIIIIIIIIIILQKQSFQESLSDTLTYSAYRTLS